MIGGDLVNLKKYMRFPAAILCVCVVICILLLVLPVDQIVKVYKVVNGIKTVEYLPKFAGIAGILGTTIVLAVIWSLVRKGLDTSVSRNDTQTSYRVIRFFVNAVFCIWAVLPSFMGILSIILLFNGD